MPTRRAWHWLARHPWFTSLIMVAAVVGASVAVLAEQDARQDRFVACVAEWADRSAARTGELGPKRAAVDEANDALWRMFAELLDHPRPDSRTVFRAELGTYEAASDAYAAALERNPIPPPPRLECGR